MRVLLKVQTIAAVALATWGWSARVDAQHAPSLAVVREYDNDPAGAVTPRTASPLAIVRSYEDGEAIADRSSLAPWESTPMRTRTTLAIVTVFDGDDVSPTTRHAPLMLLTYEGAEVVRSVRDPAVHLLTMVTDFDGHAPTVTTARVYIAYDEQGGVVRVETALPPMNVNTSPSEDDGPVVTMGSAITSARTGAARTPPRSPRVPWRAVPLNPPR